MKRSLAAALPAVCRRERSEEEPPLPLQPGQTVAPQFEELYADSGSSLGAGFVGTAHLGIHF